MRARPDRETLTSDGTGGKPGIRIDGITTVIDDEPILHRLNLDVPPGQITVVMGPSGAGKSTLVRHICGLQEPDRGTIAIGGRDVWGASRDQLQEIRRGMSVMLGGSSLFDTSLFGSLNAYDNLEYTLKSIEVPQAQRASRVMARLKELALEDVADRTPDTLPAHAKRRLALARALVTDSPLLIVDDVDVCLDAAHTGRILAALANWRERTQGTLLLTTHKIPLARELGDNLAILCNGRITSTGNAKQLLSGVDTNEQFDQRFQISDFIGPPRIEDVRRDEEERRGITMTIDPHMVRAAMLAAAAVAVIVVFAHFLLHII